MGVYVYKVTSKKVKLTNGVEANVAVFAYKENIFEDQERTKFLTGCFTAERYVEGPNYSGNIVIGRVSDDGVFVGSTVGYKCAYGFIGDDSFNCLPIVGETGLKAAQWGKRVRGGKIVEFNGIPD